MLMGICSTIGCELLFGFSQNMIWAMSSRCLWGILNGNMGVAKTYISEICDDTNQAKGFAAVGTTGALGRLMGSVVGGFLAQPANKYQFLQFQVFCDYPYCLPCIVGAFLSCLSLVAAWLFLDETLQTRKAVTPSNNNNASSENSSDSRDNDSAIELLQPVSGSSVNSYPQDNHGVVFDDEESGDGEGSNLLESDSDAESDNDANSHTELIGNLNRMKYGGFCSRLREYKEYCLRWFSLALLAGKVKQRVAECIGGFMVCVVGIWKFNYSQCKPLSVKKTVSMKWRSWARDALKTVLLLRDRKVSISIGLYGLLAFFAIIINELFPLLMITNHEHGGYLMDTSEIGVVLSVTSVMQLLFQFFVFPRVAKCLGYRHTFKLGTVLFAISSVLLPFSNKISGPISSDAGKVPIFSGNGSGSGSVVLDNSTPFCGVPLYENTTDYLTRDSLTRVPARVWVVIITIIFVQIIGRIISLTSTMVLISNASLPETRGTVNGYGQSAAALGRVIGPIMGATTFAWSETLNNHWPLNFHLVFDLLAIATIGTFILSLFLPRSIEQKRENVAPSSTIAAAAQEAEPTSSSDQLVCVLSGPDLNSEDTRANCNIVSNTT